MQMIQKVSVVAAGALLAMGAMGQASAAPGDSGQGVGGCIDQFHGNATNPRDSGNGVIPSQSPGPWVNNPTDPENPTMGTPLGQLIQEFHFNPSMLRGQACPF